MAAIQRVSAGNWIDYLRLGKPVAIIPHLITAASAMFLAVNGPPPLSTLILTLLGGGLVAAGANTINCYFDRELDKQMARTRLRPLPAGRLSPYQALTFGIITGAAGLLMLGQFVGLATAALALFALFYYACVYTLLLKTHSPWSILIGSGVGAITPLIGWIAVTRNIEATPFILSIIIVLWTLPHFWALAIFRQKDYEKAGIRVMPRNGVNVWIITSSILLVAVTILLKLVASLGLFYLLIAIVLGLGFIFLAMGLKHTGSLSKAWRLYVYSIFYIALLFTVIIVDRVAF
jgi:heme o synthase